MNRICRVRFQPRRRFLIAAACGCSVLGRDAFAQPSSQPGCYPALPLGEARIKPSLGDVVLGDQFVAEVRFQQSFWSEAHPAGLPSNVILLDEGHPANANAYAYENGVIAFGSYFFQRHLRAHGWLAIAGTLAHEFAHLVHYRYRWPRAVPAWELEADGFAAYYLAASKRQDWNAIRGFFAHVARLGDYNFTSPLHHGTPCQRNAAAYLGVSAAVQGARQGGFTAAALHRLFEYGIARQILPDQRYARSLADDADGEVAALVDRLPLAEIAEGRSEGENLRVPQDGALGLKQA